jgi:hypothetical protein
MSINEKTGSRVTNTLFEDIKQWHSAMRETMHEERFELSFYKVQEDEGVCDSMVTREMARHTGERRRHGLLHRAMLE